MDKMVDAWNTVLAEDPKLAAANTEVAQASSIEEAIQLLQRHRKEQSGGAAQLPCLATGSMYLVGGLLRLQQYAV
jgi:hypothetical protein